MAHGSEHGNFSRSLVSGLDDWAVTLNVSDWFERLSFSDIRSTALQEGRIPLVPLQNCTEAYRLRQTVTSQMLCAVSTDWQVDTCKVSIVHS